MFRPEKKPIPKSTTINVLIGGGGTGDLVCSIPALKHLISSQHWINPLVWVPDHLLTFFKHFLPNNVTIRNYTEANKKYNEKLIGVTTKWLPHRTAMRIHPIDHSYISLLDMYPYDTRQRSYPRVRAEEIDLSDFDLPEKYVVIVATAAEIVKTMPVETMNSIVDYVKSKGYEVVFVGQEKVDNGREVREIPKLSIDFTKGLNLVNKTSLLELAAIMDKSKAVIGMDGGPIHIAGFSSAPIIAGYTFASPDHLMPIRDGVLGKDVYPIVPPESLECRFCQTNWNLLYGTDFRSCYYGNNDYTCVKNMSFNDFKIEIDKVLCQDP